MTDLGLELPNARILERDGNAGTVPLEYPCELTHRRAFEYQTGRCWRIIIVDVVKGGGSRPECADPLKLESHGSVRPQLELLPRYSTSSVEA